MILPRDLSGDLLAAVDLGSNSFALEIARLQHGRYRRVDYLKEAVRLGAGLDDDGLLTEEAAQRGLQCLARFAARLGSVAPTQVRAVATQTLREARNRDAFLARAQAVLGHPIEVISGREEARLIYAGVAYLTPSRRRRLVIDIGGSSTEMILGRRATVELAESFSVGCVGLSMRWFTDGRLSADAFHRAQIAAGAELEEALQPFARVHWDEAIGSSGTVGAVSRVLTASGVSDGRITPAGLRWLIDQCLKAGHVEHLALRGLRDDRRAVFAGGLSILYTLAAHFEIDKLWPARGALRPGVILDLQRRRYAAEGGGLIDVRDASVHALQKRLQVDRRQAARVRRAALALYAGAAPGHGESTRELGWACDLHEIGLMVSHHDHHRHSAYLMAHADTPGFSQSQQRRVAELLLGQRGGLRKVDELLADPQRAWQLLSLRLGLILCHARERLDATDVRLERQGRTAWLTFSAQWAARHPRTLHLLREEAAAWARLDSLRLELA